MLIQIGIEKRDLILSMKKAIASSSVFLIIILTVFCFNAAAAASSNGRLNRPGSKSVSKYSAILKRLNFYKKALAFLSSKISKEEKDIKDLKNKIKNAKGKIKKLKDKIKKDVLLIKDLTTRIFIINKEYGSAKLLSFKDNADSFIVNYQLKTLLQKEEIRLSKLIKRKNKFLKLKKYLKKEKNSLIADVNSVKHSKKRLKQLIAGLNIYIKSLKINNDKNYNGYLSKKRGNMRKHNKKNRLLKRKVIKLIKNLKNKSRGSGVIFQIIK